MSKLRPIDKKRMTLARELPDALPTGDDIGFIHTVLAQCFLPYRDPKQRDWQKISGDYAIILTSGTVQNPQRPRADGCRTPLWRQTAPLSKLCLHAGH